MYKFASKNCFDALMAVRIYIPMGKHCPLNSDTNQSAISLSYCLKLLFVVQKLISIPTNFNIKYCFTV